MNGSSGHPEGEGIQEPGPVSNSYDAANDDDPSSARAGRDGFGNIIQFPTTVGNRYRMCGGGSVLNSGPGYTIGGVMIGSRLQRVPCW